MAIEVSHIYIVKRDNIDPNSRYSTMYQTKTNHFFVDNGNYLEQITADEALEISKNTDYHDLIQNSQKDGLITEKKLEKDRSY